MFASKLTDGNKLARFNRCRHPLQRYPASMVNSKQPYLCTSGYSQKGWDLLLNWYRQSRCFRKYTGTL